MRVLSVRMFLMCREMNPDYPLASMIFCRLEDTMKDDTYRLLGI